MKQFHCSMKGRMRRAAVLGVFAVLLGMASCSRRPLRVPYDPATAQYRIDVLPDTGWVYQDEALPLHFEPACWDATGKAAMAYEQGAHRIECLLTCQAGPSLTYVYQWSPGTPASADVAFRDNGAPPPAGKHKLTVQMRLPSGKMIKGGFVRDVDIRRRELRLSLTADKMQYQIGDAIVLRGSIINLLDEAIDFTQYGPAEVVLHAAGAGGGRELKMAISRPVPWGMLAPGEARQIFELRFEAGKEAAWNDSMWETEFGVPGPFAVAGDYEITCTAQIRTTSAPPERQDWYAKPWLASVPGSVSFTVGPVGGE